VTQIANPPIGRLNLGSKSEEHEIISSINFRVSHWQRSLEKKPFPTFQSQQADQSFFLKKKTLKFFHGFFETVLRTVFEFTFNVLNSSSSWKSFC